MVEGVIVPDWPAPAGVKSLVTTRLGGHSKAPYDSFNLALHVGDDPRNVEANRGLLNNIVARPIPWLQQVHGSKVLEADAMGGPRVSADGVFTKQARVACAVMTADCLPVLLCSENGDVVAAAHCGWRSLAAGILAEVVAAMPRPPALAYLGPAISQDYFEVGEDVFSAFKAAQQERCFAISVDQAFKPHTGTTGKYYADIYMLARSELKGLGVDQTYGGEFCTVSDPQFYSYRQSHITGRMASLIWIEEN